MKILITGRHVGVTEPMKEYARSKAEKLMRYFERATSCRVTMDVNHQDHAVEMVIDVSRGTRLVGKALAPDMYAACDLAEQKLAQQLRKHKERPKKRRRRRRKRPMKT
jgi:putative sigma-54 modulation protein